MPHWSFGGALNPPDTTWTGSILIGTAPERWTCMWCIMKTGLFKITSNTIQLWQGTGVPRVSLRSVNMEGVVVEDV